MLSLKQVFQRAECSAIGRSETATETELIVAITAKTGNRCALIMSRA